MEEIVYIVEDAIPAGVFHAEKDAWAFNQYDLLFTNKRIVLAVVRHQKDGQAAFAAPSGSGRLDELGKLGVDVRQLKTMHGTVKRWMDIKKERRKQFKGKTPEEILHLHPDSFEIPYNNVKSVKLRKWSIFGTTIEIRALWKGEERKIRLRIPKKRFENVERVIRNYLPHR